MPATQRHGGWILNVEGPARVEPEDVPAGVRALLGRCRWQVEVHLEGEVSESAQRALHETIGELIPMSLGIVDPQRDVLIDSAGERQVPAIAEPDDDATGYVLQVYFERADKFTRDDMDRVLEIIEEAMPEALPHRYGRWEPLQNRWEEGGRTSFLNDWSRQDPPFWKGKTPVSDASCSFDYKVRDYGFRAGMISINFRPSLTADPSKVLAALRLGERLAVATDAFYAGLIPVGSSQGPFWKGVAPAEHLLFVLGEPLLSLWPEFRELGRPVDDRHFAASGLSGSAKIQPPARLCFSKAGPGDEFAFMGLTYAADFPFPKSDPYQPKR